MRTKNRETDPGFGGQVMHTRKGGLLSLIYVAKEKICSRRYLGFIVETICNHNSPGRIDVIE
jgi:hypothetical protein